MRAKIPTLILCLILAVATVYYLVSVYELVAETYVVTEDDLFKVDTFHLAGRAFSETDPTSGGRHSHDSKLVFRSTNRYKFAIERNRYKAIIDKNSLMDSMMYHDLRFVVYTTQKYFKKYREAKEPIFIPVFQLEIGGKKYIDLSRSNRLKKGELFRGATIPAAMVCFFAFVFFKRRDGWWTKRRILLWSLAFFFTILILLLVS